VRAKVFNDEACEEELALKKLLTDLRPMVRKALNTIDIDMETISRLREEATVRAATVAERTRQDLSTRELLAVAGRLQHRSEHARRKTR
jgi:hypothetical protein